MNGNWITVGDMCDLLGISKTTAYKIIKKSELKSGKIGGKIVIERKSLEKYMEKIFCD